MLEKIWQWIKSFFSRLFGSSRQTASRKIAQLEASEASAPAPAPAFTDTDYEFLFSQLLEGIAQGWEKARVDRFFASLGERGQPDLWAAWLRRFGDRVLAATNPNNELAARLVRLGNLDNSEFGTLAAEIGMELLKRDTAPARAIWEYAGPDAYDEADQILQEGMPGEQAMNFVTLEELQAMLATDQSLVEQLAQQMGVAPDLEAVWQVILQQVNASQNEAADNP